MLSPLFKLLYETAEHQQGRFGMTAGSYLKKRVLNARGNFLIALSERQLDPSSDICKQSHRKTLST